MKPPFGLAITPGSAATIAARVLRPRSPAQGLGLVVTPNVDHVVRLWRDPAFAGAYRRAAVMLCDGAPLRAYARARGHRLRRVTGCDLTVAVLRGVSGQRLFFVVDGPATEAAVRTWAEARGLGPQVATAVPPFGFARDQAAAAALAARIAAHRPDILVMGVGSPQSEVFADAWAAALPPCWVLCVGQGVKVALGLVRRAPPVMQAAQAEFLWRLGQEPRRLAGRYSRGAVLFLLAVLADLAGRFRFAAELPAAELP